MLDSLLLYAGVAAAFLGVLSSIRPFLPWFRTRGKAAVLLVAGLAVAAAAMALPFSEEHAASPATLLDAAMPVWQFSEHHAVEIEASPERVFEAIHAVPASEIALFRTLVAIRRLGRSGPEGILNPSEREPLLSVATRTSFVLLDDQAPRELVVGTVVAVPRGFRAAGRRLTRDVFFKKLPPGFALATMNFLVTAEGPGRCRLTTETRVYANTGGTARRFAAYWRVIHPGSDLIRRMWLRAIKRRAEGRQA